MFDDAQTAMLNQPPPSATDDQGSRHMRQLWSALLERIRGVVATIGQLILTPKSAAQMDELGSDFVVRDVTSALVKVALARRPKPPISNKWTKLGPATDWFVITFAFSLLEPLVSPGGAFAKFKFESESGSTATIAE